MLRKKYGTFIDFWSYLTYNTINKFKLFTYFPLFLRLITNATDQQIPTDSKIFTVK